MDETITFPWHGKTVELGLTRIGTGPRVLLLPAPSSISTRREMAGLQTRLVDVFETVAVDLPGFGDRPRPALPWSPDTYRTFLDAVTREIRPAATIAAGHAALYLLGQAAAHPGSAGRLVLIAPTWRGPLPSMAGKRHGWFDTIAKAVDIPLAGSLLYRLTVNPPVIRMMARGHVYENETFLAGPRLAEKRAVTEARGARHASVRFVAGALDPFTSREAMLEAARTLRDPALIVIGGNSPPKSTAEMQALAALPGIQTARLQHGKFGVHEEFPDDVAAAILPFLASGMTQN